MAGLSDGFRGNRHVLGRPLKRAAIVAVLATLGLFGHSAYSLHQVSRVVEPTDARLRAIRSTGTTSSESGVFGGSWSSTYRFPEERINRESHDIIRDALKSHGWDLQEELTAILPDNLMGGYLIRAEKWGYTYIAHLPKSGADLRVEVAKTGKPQVSRPVEEMEITGR